MKQTCKICGKEFNPKPNELFCSPECRRENRNRKQRERYKKPVEVKCAHCGKIFETKTTAKKYCSDRCRETSYWKRRAAEYAKPSAKMHCEECGKEFEPRLSTQRYCSPQCAEIYIKPKSTAKSQPKSQPKSQGKALSDWCREAAECNLDYGNYRALIESGKNFDELKSRADSRGVSGHSHHRKVAW